jgi:hypothetical protein
MNKAPPKPGSMFQRQVRRRKPEERVARRAYGETEKRTSHRRQSLKSQGPANRHRLETPRLRSRSQGGWRFAWRRSKMDIAVRDWGSDGHHIVPAHSRFDWNLRCRKQSRPGSAPRQSTCRARRSPSSPGWRANKPRKRPIGRLSTAVEQVVAGGSSNSTIARTGRADDKSAVE